MNINYMPFVISLLYCIVFHFSHKKWIQQNTLQSLTRLDDSGLQKTKHKNSTTLLLGVPIAWFGCAYWLWSPYLPCWACCISTCQLLLKSLSLTRSPAPSPPEIHRMIWVSAWRYVALAFCWLAWLAWKPRCSLIGWRNDVKPAISRKEGSFLRTAVPIQWNGLFVSIIWYHSCNICSESDILDFCLGIFLQTLQISETKNTSVNLRPVCVKLVHHTKKSMQKSTRLGHWTFNLMSWFQGGCLQSPDHQIGFDQYRRSGRLYSTDAYAVHSVPRFGVNMVTCVVKKTGMTSWVWMKPTEEWLLYGLMVIAIQVFWRVRGFEQEV